jgi:hypothetical protein
MFKIISLRNYHTPLRVIAALLIVLILLVAFRSNDRPAQPSSQPLIESAWETNKTDEELKDLMKDYQLKLYDNFIVIYDGQRVVGTLTYRTSLGRLVMKDNE